MRRKQSLYLCLLVVYSLYLVLLFLILLFSVADPYLIGMAIIFTVTFLIMGILLLIRDMDNPFETGGTGSADVDLSHIYELDKYLKSQ